MISRIASARAWPAAVTALLILCIGQLGRLPVPDAYRQPEDRSYRLLEERVTSRASDRPFVQPDVVVMGDSRVQFGISPTTLARHLRLAVAGNRSPIVLNLAAPAAGFATDLWLWRRLTRSARRMPALLIVGVSELQLTGIGPGRDMALRYHFGLSDTSWLLRSGRAADVATMLTYRLLPLYARRLSIRNWMARHRYLEFPRPAPRRELRRYYNWYEKYCVDPFEQTSLDALIRAAQGAGSRVVLVSPPISAIHLAMADGGLPPPGIIPASQLRNRRKPRTSPLRLFEAAISRCAMRHQVPYFDYLTLEQSARFQYWDTDHLSFTHEGGRKFTRELAERINELLVPAARRDDSRR